MIWLQVRDPVTPGTLRWPKCPTGSSSRGRRLRRRWTWCSSTLSSTAQMALGKHSTRPRSVQRRLLTWVSTSPVTVLASNKLSYKYPNIMITMVQYYIPVWITMVCRNSYLGGCCNYVFLTLLMAKNLVVNLLYSGVTSNSADRAA